jgi:serine/threonine protein kinase
MRIAGEQVTVNGWRDPRRATDHPPVGDGPVEAGARIGRYVVLGEHARGGVGRILRAMDLVLDRPVAIKQLLMPGRDADARFRREARLTARLDHPSIIPVYDAGRWPAGGRPYYAMKMIEGRSLRELIDQAGSLDRRLPWLASVVAAARAIDHAHRRRILHRDLKPTNVLVDTDGATIVIDWGLAKDLAEPGRAAAVDLHDCAIDLEAPPGRRPAESLAPEGPVDPRWAPALELTVEGDVLGTPSFMAPEQALGEEADERTDVYALGALAYFVVTGRAPHADDDPATLLLRAAAGASPPVRDRQPDAPAELAALFERAMSRDPSERHASAAELADDLERLLGRDLTRSRQAARSRAWRRLASRRARSGRGAPVPAVVDRLPGRAVEQVQKPLVDRHPHGLAQRQLLRARDDRAELDPTVELEADHGLAPLRHQIDHAARHPAADRADRDVLRADADRRAR